MKYYAVKMSDDRVFAILDSTDTIDGIIDFFGVKSEDILEITKEEYDILKKITSVLYKLYDI